MTPMEAPLKKQPYDYPSLTAALRKHSLKGRRPELLAQQKATHFRYVLLVLTNIGRETRKKELRRVKSFEFPRGLSSVPLERAVSLPNSCVD